jgi:hypothetical protein
VSKESREKTAFPSPTEAFSSSSGCHLNFITRPPPGKGSPIPYSGRSWSYSCLSTSKTSGWSRNRSTGTSRFSATYWPGHLTHPSSGATWVYGHHMQVDPLPLYPAPCLLVADLSLLVYLVAASS